MIITDLETREDLDITTIKNLPLYAKKCQVLATRGTTNPIGRDATKIVAVLRIYYPEYFI